MPAPAVTDLKDRDALLALVAELQEALGIKDPADVTKILNRRADRTPQRTPAKLRGPKRWLKFLDSLEQMPVVAEACRVANVSRSHAYERRQKIPSFARLWDAALETGLDRIEAEAMQRATTGRRKLVIHKGEVVFVWRMEDGTVVPHSTAGATCEALYEDEYSDTLMIQILKAHRRERYGDRLDMNVTKDSEVEKEIRELTEAMKKAARGKPVPAE